jgi:hypothetical protein
MDRNCLNYVETLWANAGCIFSWIYHLLTATSPDTTRNAPNVSQHLLRYFLKCLRYSVSVAHKVSYFRLDFFKVTNTLSCLNVLQELFGTIFHHVLAHIRPFPPHFPQSSVYVCSLRFKL